MRRRASIAFLALLIFFFSPSQGICMEPTLPLSPALRTVAGQYDLYSGELTLDQIDFKKLERISTEEVLCEYLLDCQAALIRQVPVRVAPALNIQQVTDSMQFYEWTFLTCEYYADTGYYLLTFELAPGAKIAQAFLRRDVSRLNRKELQVYLQLEIFFQMHYPWRASVIERERSIHDYISASCKYWTNNGSYSGNYTDFRSIIGVFVDGRANCSGVTDAFHVMCTIAGIPSQKVTGEMNGIPHIWNTVQIDGKWYMVDVTNNGLLTETIPYQYFNAGLDLMRKAHTWKDSVLHVSVVEETDGKYAYGNVAFADLMRVPDMKTMQNSIIARALAEGSGVKQSYYCELFIGEIKPFVDSVLAGCRAENNGIQQMSVSYQYETLGKRLYLTLSITYE